MSTTFSTFYSVVQYSQAFVNCLSFIVVIVIVHAYFTMSFNDVCCFRYYNMYYGGDFLMWRSTSPTQTAEVGASQQRCILRRPNRRAPSKLSKHYA